MKRLFLLLLACSMVTGLSSCAVIGGLVQSVLRLPGSLLKSLTEESTPNPGEGHPTPGQPDVDEANEESVLVVTPLARD